VGCAAGEVAGLADSFGNYQQKGDGKGLRKNVAGHAAFIPPIAKARWMGHPRMVVGGGLETMAKADPFGMTTKEAMAKAKAKVLEAGGEGLAEICG
jgi:hypothetical protein